MSTSCVYPLATEHAFRFARLAGYDGVEVMVTNDEVTQDAESLLALSARYELPILSIHAPVLLLTHFVWGRDPQVKLERSAELAAAVGATTVVVHPPFRWQSGYAENFLDIVRETAADTGVEIAVENMFPWKVGGRTLKAYSPGRDPRDMDCDAMTLDFSHAALSGLDSLDFAADSATGCGTSTSATARARSTRAASSTSTCCPGTAASRSPRCSGCSPPTAGRAASSPRSTPARRAPRTNGSGCSARRSSSPARTRRSPRIRGSLARRRALASMLPVRRSSASAVPSSRTSSRAYSL